MECSAYLHLDCVYFCLTGNSFNRDRNSDTHTVLAVHPFCYLPLFGCPVSIRHAGKHHRAQWRKLDFFNFDHSACASLGDSQSASYEGCISQLLCHQTSLKAISIRRIHERQPSFGILHSAEFKGCMGYILCNL